MHRKFQKDSTIIYETMGDLGCEPQIRKSGRRNTATYAYDEFRETRKMSYCSRLKQTLLKFQLYYNF